MVRTQLSSPPGPVSDVPDIRRRGTMTYSAHLTTVRTLRKRRTESDWVSASAAQAQPTQVLRPTRLNTCGGRRDFCSVLDVPMCRKQIEIPVWYYEEGR